MEWKKMIKLMKWMSDKTLSCDKTAGDKRYQYIKR